MAQPTLKGLRVAILATDGFEQSELLEPMKSLDAAGAATEVVAPMTGDIRGRNHKEWGESVHVTQVVRDANPADYDARVLPGGVLNPDSLRMQAEAVVDANLLTSRKPDDLPAFSREMIALYLETSGQGGPGSRVRRSALRGAKSINYLRISGLRRVPCVR
jgi:putative intracellular protease/amidase